MRALDRSPPWRWRGTLTRAVHAQTPAVTPNQGAITFRGGLDVPTVYFFRGILQEGNPSLTLWPYGDLRVALASGDGRMKSVAINVGVWNSLHTGTAGTGGPLDKLHYQEDFYTTLNLGLAHGLGVATTFVARTSPNGSFNTIRELDIKVVEERPNRAIWSGGVRIVGYRPGRRWLEARVPIWSSERRPRWRSPSPARA